MSFFFIFQDFKERPKTPPSAAAAMQKKASEQSNIVNDLRILLRKGDFILMMVAYGVNNGVFNSFMILFNSGVLKYFPVSGILRLMTSGD